MEKSGKCPRRYSGWRFTDFLTRHCSYSIALHDGTYSIHCETQPSEPIGGSSNESSRDGSGVSTPMSLEKSPEGLANAIIGYLDSYRQKHLSKPMGASLTLQMDKLSPHLAVRLWAELDIVPFVFPMDPGDPNETEEHKSMPLDQQAEWMAKKAVKQFNVKGELPVEHGIHRQVLVDLNSRARIAELESYDSTMNTETTGAATMHYADSLVKRGTRIAFFNSTAQGGGVALMRHALIRYLRLAGVDCKWYVPFGQPEIFRITKDNHNILQGVAKHGERLTDKKIEALDAWVLDEVRKCNWMEDGGPLSAREKGGADVIIVDDPQMPSLVKIAKENDPSRPVIFRSHIQVRADLADQEGTATSEVWQWIWNHGKCESLQEGVSCRRQAEVASDLVASFW
jgi:hypothetical protein